MKPFIIGLTTVVIAVTLICQVAVAAEVTRVSAREGEVFVNSGKNAGFIVGAEVCIYSNSKEIACGNIFRTTDDYAVLRVDRQAVRYIENGMTAKLVKKDAD